MPRIKRKLAQQPAEQNSTLEVCVKPVQYNTAVYTRLSLEDNNIFDGTSIVSQRDMLIQFVSEQICACFPSIVIMVTRVRIFYARTSSVCWMILKTAKLTASL